jgi:uncharacterized protein with HEPN domain
MLEAADAIARYAAKGRSQFEADSEVRDAILYQITVLGEAAKAALTAEPGLETSAPEIEWSPIGRMRDRVIHHYWTTDNDIVWSTATESVPQIRIRLATLLARLSA